MFALIYSALLRFFGSGGAAASQPALADSLPHSPGFQHLLKQAEALKKAPPPEPMTWGEAVRILARLDGQRPASEAPPPEWRVELALAALPPLVLLYLRVLEALGRTFPSAGKDDDAEFKRRLTQLALTDVNTWLAGLFCGKAVTIPEHITAVLVQRASNMLGQAHPVAIMDDREPDFFFFVEAELQMCVIDLDTRYCVFPRVIGRGDTDPIEIPGTDKRFHRDTVTASNWAFRLGFAGQVFEPPAIPDAADDAAGAVAELIPQDIPQQANPQR
jgi:hypothetical protein